MSEWNYYTLISFTFILFLLAFFKTFHSFGFFITISYVHIRNFEILYLFIYFWIQTNVPGTKKNFESPNKNLHEQF